jgi:hypothetical protein
MKIMKHQFLFPLIVILLISACTYVDETGAATPFQSAKPPTSDSRFVETVSPTQGAKKDVAQMTQSPTSTGMEFLIEKAKEDLAQRLSIDVAEISLAEAKEVVWPDASLGCPQPGIAYKQIPQDGALILLQVGINIYEYHSGGSRGVFLCEKLKKDSDSPPKLDIHRP